MSVIARNQLASALRSLRKERGFTQTDVAENMEWSLSKVIRIENGTVGISVSDLRSLLAFFEVTFGRDELLELARGGKSDRQRWWKSYHDRVPPQLLDLAAYEAEATRVTVFAPIAVPELLQTEAYARAVYGDQTLVDFHLRRRSALLAGQAQLEFILDESLLHRTPDGGEILAAQLESIVEDTSLHNVAVYVLPYTAGAHPGWAGGFTVVDCNGHQVLATAEGYNASEDPATVHHFALAAVTLERVALGFTESIEAITKQVEALR
jgi:transcriptional regulator with XRE-family HTH domain